MLVEAGVGGGIMANVALSLNDPQSATDGGKLRYSQIETDAQAGPLNVFDFGGELTASLNAFVKVGISPFAVEYDLNFAQVTLLDFDTTTPPPILGTESNGVVTLALTAGNADISGATVGVDNFAIEDLGPDTTNGGEIIDVGASGNDQIFDGVTQIVAEGKTQPFNLNIEEGVTAPVLVAGGYLPTDPSFAPTTNSVQISDVGSGAATIYASDGNDQIRVGSADATIYAGNDTTGGVNIPKDVIQLGNAPADGGTNHIYGGTAAVTIDGGAGNDYIQVGNAATAVVDGGGGNNTIIGGTGSDHFVVNFAEQDVDTITALAGATNYLEIDGGGGGETITVGTASDGIHVTSLDNSVQDSVIASNIQSLDVEPALPGVDPSGLPR